ncbi:MAG: proton-conducting transporter membrane subunit [Calditrichia bacterium]
MEILPILALLTPFTTGILCLLSFRTPKLQTVFAVTGSLVFLSLSFMLILSVRKHGILVIQIGNWPAPFGISFVADLFSAAMVFLTALIGAVTGFFSIRNIDRERKNFGYFPLVQFMLMGLSGAFLTGDIFNLYVWFEVTLISSFVLMTLGGLTRQLEGALKYVTINLIGSALFLTGIGILYGKVGTLNMADLAVRLGSREGAFVVNSAAMLFFTAFGIKAAFFPLFFWLPASYPAPPAAVSALFAGLLTKLGIYALIRTFTLFFSQDILFNQYLILVIAAFTMLTGALGAISEKNLNRLLSFSIISQMGYILMGLGISTPLALAGAVFFIFHEAIAKTAMFLIAGIVEQIRGSSDIQRLGGFFKFHPYLSGCFLFAGLSLAGLPPFSGFIAKFTLVKAGLEAGQFIIIIIALAVAVLTLLYIMKVWQNVFWKPLPDTAVSAHRQTDPLLFIPASFLAVLTVLLGVFAQPFIEYALAAGNQLMNPAEYIQAVLGVKP